MLAYIAFSAFGILLALFLAVFKKKCRYRLVSAIIAAALAVGAGVLTVDSVFFREIRETEIRLDEFINNEGGRKGLINFIHGSDGEKYWCFGKIDGGYYLRNNAQPVRVEYCANTKLVLKIEIRAEYRVPILSDGDSSDYIGIYSFESEFVFFVLAVGFVALAVFVWETVKKGVEI